MGALRGLLFALRLFDCALSFSASCIVRPNKARDCATDLVIPDNATYSVQEEQKEIAVISDQVIEADGNGTF